jgi:hypothetical protein
VSWIVRLSGIGADATPALEQLELIVAYLYKIRKPELVRAVDRNGKRILERIS